MQETASEQDRGRHTLQPWTTPVGPLAERSHERGKISLFMLHCISHKHTYTQ